MNIDLWEKSQCQFHKSLDKVIEEIQAKRIWHSSNLEGLIRKYVAIGLLPKASCLLKNPQGKGRIAHYSDEFSWKLEEILRLRSKGADIATIFAILDLQNTYSQIDEDIYLYNCTAEDEELSKAERDKAQRESESLEKESKVLEEELNKLYESFGTHRSNLKKITVQQTVTLNKNNLPVKFNYFGKTYILLGTKKGGLLLNLIKRSRS